MPATLLQIRVIHVRVIHDCGCVAFMLTNELRSRSSRNETGRICCCPRRSASGNLVFLPVVRILVLVSLFLGLGCTHRKENTAVSADKTAKEHMKSMLEGVAETGRGGSELGAVKQELKRLEKTDPELARLLEQDLESLMASAADRPQRKRIAEEMIETLENGWND